LACFSNFPNFENTLSGKSNNFDLALGERTSLDGAEPISPAALKNLNEIAKKASLVDTLKESNGDLRMSVRVLKS
jgi:hypothetical protein